MVGRMSGRLLAVRRRSVRPPMTWSHPLLKAYANKLDTIIDHIYPGNGGEQKTVEHWQRCTNAVAMIRQSILTALGSYQQP